MKCTGADGCYWIRNGAFAYFKKDSNKQSGLYPCSSALHQRRQSSDSLIHQSLPCPHTKQMGSSPRKPLNKGFWLSVIDPSECTLPNALNGLRLWLTKKASSPMDSTFFIFKHSNLVYPQNTWSQMVKTQSNSTTDSMSSRKPPTEHALLLQDQQSFW